MLNTLIARALGRTPKPAFAEGAFVAFVTSVDAPQRVSATERHFSSIASTRLRVLIPAQQLAQQVPVWLVPPEELAKRPDLSHLGRPGAIVLGKLATKDVLARRDALRQLLQHARDGACPSALYADLPDDYAALGEALREPLLAEYQKDLGSLFAFVVPCAGLAQALASYAKRGIVVIEDPYESATQRPVRVAPASPLRLVWFGNLSSVNVAQVEEAFGAIASGLADKAIRLEAVTAEKGRTAVQAMGARLRARNPGVEVAFTAWSLEATEAALERSDFVLLPQDHRSPWGRIKSHNRLVAAIRAGRFAVASPIPAYEELADYAWVGEDLAAGLRWAITHPEEAASRVAEGQRYVQARFAPEVVGRKWAQALGIIHTSGLRPD